MKRTPIKRKTPLKAKAPLKPGKGLKRTAMPQASKPLVARTALTRKTPMSQGGFVASNQSTPNRKPTQTPKKKNSMSGHGRTKADKELHSAIIGMGCIACRVMGRAQVHPSQLHHPIGRNKGKEGDFCEQYVICLCAEHHDQRIYHGFQSASGWVKADRSMPSVHHNKKGFVAMFGTEESLVLKTYELLGRKPVWLDRGDSLLPTKLTAEGQS